jgi:outer membrane immunogenic protein
MFRKLLLFVLSSVMIPSVAAALSRSDFAVSGLGVYNQNSTGNGILQIPTNSGGVLASYRLGFGTHSDLELNYAFNRNSQYYNDTLFGPLAAQQANVHELTGSYVFHLSRSRRFDPFVLAGGGALLFRPISSADNSFFGASTQAQGTFLYGGGLDYGLGRNFALRLQYRGLVYQAPDFGATDLSAGTWTHTAEPSVGLVFRF